MVEAINGDYVLYADLEKEIDLLEATRTGELQSALERIKELETQLSDANILIRSLTLSV